jgi:hypothetical protein
LRLWRSKSEVNIKCINGRFALPVTFLISKLKRTPFILWTGIWSDIETPAHRLFFPLTRFILRHSDAIVVYGDHVKQYVASLGVDDKKIFIAHHAVDNDAFSRDMPPEAKDRLRRELDVPPEATVVL